MTESSSDGVLELELLELGVVSSSNELMMDESDASLPNRPDIESVGECVGDIAAVLI